MSTGRVFRARLRGLLLAAPLTLAAVLPAQAQVSRAVVQPLPAQGSAQLNAALGRLAANPRDVAALIDAGNAALALGDTDAALGFYAKADQLSPGNPRVKSALASAMVRNEDPFEAIPLFDAAERAGASVGLTAGDRGLAYDLVGDNPSAQRYYRQALAAAPSPEIARRLALSLAIAGDRKAAEAAILPQVQRNDPAGWRTRAFVLAILGDADEAVRIAYGTMPKDLADAMAPYLRYMPRLTRAQQAAAANFGHFPRAAQIGRDDPRVARYAAASPQRPVVRTADAGLVPQGVALGSKTRPPARTAKKGKERKPVALASAAPSPAPTPAQTSTSTAQPVRIATVASPPPQPVRIAAATPNPLAASAQPTPSPTPTPAPVPPIVLNSPATASPSPGATASNLALAREAQQGPSESGAPVLTQSAPTPAPTPTPTPTPTAAAAPPPLDLAAAFKDFAPPAEEQAKPSVAVDLARIAAARKKAAAAEDRGPPPDAPSGTRRTPAPEPAAIATRKGAKAPPARDAKPAKVAPSHPSRIWVQIGVGRDKGALAFDWRKATRESAALVKGKKAWTTPLGQTNRLLVGPFDSQAAAQAFLKAWKKTDADAFVWTSPAGQAIDALVAK